MENHLYQLKKKHMKTPIKTVVLDKNRNWVVPVTIPISKGVEVIRLKTSKYSPYAFGTPDEAIGVVSEIGTFNDGLRTLELAVVTWPHDEIGDEEIHTLLAYQDYLNWADKQGGLNVDPLYCVDQVLFLRPLPNVRSSMDYPAVGSPFETDMKITKVKRSFFGSCITYTAYIPNLGYRNFTEDMLVTAAGRERILHEDFKEYFVSVDAQPFFTRGERVKAYDGYIYNLDETVVCKITDELRKILSWSIKQEELK